MAKGKESKGSSAKVTNKAMHSRVSYLYQAAAFLETRKLIASEPVGDKAEGSYTRGLTRSGDCPTQGTQPTKSGSPNLEECSHALSRKLLSDLRSVSLKAQIRLSPTMKHTICRRCSTMLIDGSTCTSEIENKSKGGKKPWADILVRRCNSCGCEKRHPVAVERQLRRPYRQPKAIMTNQS